MHSFSGIVGGALNGRSTTHWVTYLQTVLMAKAKTGELGADRLQELRTLCEVLNLFGQGRVKVAADVLVQRFKALEQKSLGNNTSSQGLELVDAKRAGLVSDEELRLTSSEARAQARLLEGLGGRRPS